MLEFALRGFSGAVSAGLALVLDGLTLGAFTGVCPRLEVPAEGYCLVNLLNDCIKRALSDA